MENKTWKGKAYSTSNDTVVVDTVVVDTVVVVIVLMEADGK